MMADPAYRLDVLWNVDKHRRLVRLDWFFDLSWGTGSGTGPDFHLPKGARLRDGTVLATFPGPPVGPEPSELGWEVGLSFSDDPFPDDVVGLLHGGTTRSADGSYRGPSPQWSAAASRH